MNATARWRPRRSPNCENRWTSVEPSEAHSQFPPSDDRGVLAGSSTTSVVSPVRKPNSSDTAEVGNRNQQAGRYPGFVKASLGATLGAILLVLVGRALYHLDSIPRAVNAVVLPLIFAGQDRPCSELALISIERMRQSNGNRAFTRFGGADRSVPNGTRQRFRNIATGLSHAATRGRDRSDPGISPGDPPGKTRD